jgi:hypothetical protein
MLSFQHSILTNCSSRRTLSCPVKTVKAEFVRGLSFGAVNQGLMSKMQSWLVSIIVEGHQHHAQPVHVHVYAHVIGADLV